METKGIVKERFEYIIGFLALVLSLNNFKEELTKIKVDLGFASFNLAQYFLTVIIATIIALHLYFLPQFIQGEGELYKKLRKLFTRIAYAFLFVILINPIVILLLIGISKLALFITKNVSLTDKLSIFTSILGGLFSLVFGFITGWVKHRKEKAMDEALARSVQLIQQIKETENLSEADKVRMYGELNKL